MLFDKALRLITPPLVPLCEHIRGTSSNAQVETMFMHTSQSAYTGHDSNRPMKVGENKYLTTKNQPSSGSVRSPHFTIISRISLHWSPQQTL